MTKAKEQLLTQLAVAVKKRQFLENKINALRRHYRKHITAVNVEIEELSNQIKL